jgi:hypothetical protein
MIAANTDPSRDWPHARWVAILDRIEHRQTDLGLKFWGPPLWLEVTMTGPDSDLWPAHPGEGQSWNWQSSEPCDAATSLVAAGADDDRLLEAVGRYTVENLILNAVHEIGEWFRFDGQRVFPAHPSGAAMSGESDDQGNGTVKLVVAFTSALGRPSTEAVESTVDQLRAQRRLRQLAEVAAPTRFTYLPATDIYFHAAGPVVRRHQPGRSPSEWRSNWSIGTLEAFDTDAEEDVLVSAVQRDVHGALVSWEADRICRALHIDGRRRWRLDAATPPLGTVPADDQTPEDEVLSLSIDYSRCPEYAGGPPPDPLPTAISRRVSIVVRRP